MTSSRRHDSLIPLSREHQYGLLLCLRLHRGLPEHANDRTWLQVKAANVVKFFDGDLRTHFQAEEEFLFPAMQNFSEAVGLLEELSGEHRLLEKLVDELRLNENNEIAESATLADCLMKFADILEAHIRKEERRLFPIYEQQASPAMTRAVDIGVKRLIGDARHPRDPELLQ